VPGIDGFSGYRPLVLALASVHLEDAQDCNDSSLKNAVNYSADLGHNNVPEKGMKARRHPKCVLQARLLEVKSYNNAFSS